ncbi:MAG: peptidase domain-containing ABC transporter [Chryseotalea sp. WA131a]|nr:MAG: peptidase domain-containing ABC transporter [Chryseotalea sp. WA131a]
MFKKFPVYRQQDSQDCGPACLKMIFEYYGKKISLEALKEEMFFTKHGVSLFSIDNAAQKYGFETLPCEVSINDIKEANLPAIIHWNSEHFVVLYKIREGQFSIADPTFGLINYKKSEFTKCWSNDKEDGVGIMLLLQPTRRFEELVIQDSSSKINIYSFIKKYLLRFKKLWFQFLLGVLMGGVVLYTIPLLTRAIVDTGIHFKDVNLIYIILLGQFFLYLSSATIEFIRRWIIVNLSSKISVNILSDFLIKMMRLPLRFFDTKIIGDILQRIEDHERIEAFISGSSLNFLISVVVFITFITVLFIFNTPIFLVFISISSLYIIYSLLFQSRRAALDFKRFNNMAQNRSNLIEIIQGMPEIKLSNSEKVRRQEWNKIQEKLFNLNMESQKLLQFQDLGSRLINDLKNIVITAISATAVVAGEFTIGQMITIQFIIGQLNVPLNDFLFFIRSSQDTKLSLKRISDIHQLQDEDSLDENKSSTIKMDNDVVINNLSFSYEGEGSTEVLKNLSLIIPKGKITAIVGSSGSGKTTLMKLLLKYYSIANNSILIGDHDLNNIKSEVWRAKCGAVLQEGFLFSDSISRNVALSDEFPNIEKVNFVLGLANLKEFVDTLPQGLNTKIGSSGVDLSVGQKQRLLIARALYKDPEFLLLDEATSSLDSRNEKIISENLYDYFFKGKTVLIIAHRLSTVKNAHKIAVLENGNIVEEGTHSELLSLKKQYYNLINNQLELA